MVALNGNLSHGEVPASEGTPSLDVIEGCDFTKRSEEVRGGPVVICGVAGLCGLSDTSPLRRRCAAPLNQSDPETELYYVRARTYNPILGRWNQRDPIGYQGGPNLHQYAASNALRGTDPQGLRHIPFIFDTFINGSLRGQWLPQTGPGGWWFATNWRGFGQFRPGESKLFTEGWVESTKIGDIKGTNGWNSFVSVTGASVITDVGVSVRRIQNGSGWLYESAKAQVVSNTHINGPGRCTTRISVWAWASYPFTVFGLHAAPPIMYSLEVHFTASKSRVSIDAYGVVTEFPDAELYLDGNLAWYRESPFSGPSFWNLGPGTDDVPISVLGYNVNADTPCQCREG